MGTSNYATTAEVFDYLNLSLDIPAFVSGSTPLPEIVDDSSTLVTASLVYLDQNRIINDTVTLSRGTSITALSPLTKDTDYTINLDTGEVSLTDTGRYHLNIGDGILYGEYKYNTFVKDSVMNDMIERASRWIDRETHQSFGTSYLVTREEQTGKGAFDRLYRGMNLPIMIAKTQLDGDIRTGTAFTAVAVSTATTAITVSDVFGFTPGDLITIGREPMQIDEIDVANKQFIVDRTHFGTANLADHSDNDWVVNMVFEISNTPVGSKPTYNILEFRKRYDVDSDTGAVQLLHIRADDRDDLSPDVFPLNEIFNRTRISYRYGNDTIPPDLTKATILVTARDMMDSTLSRSIPLGIDGFQPGGIDRIEGSITKLINKFRRLLSGGF